MQSTFRIHGPAIQGSGTSVGTIFILGRALKADPKRFAFVLVTASHVLDGINGPTATLLLRKKNKDGTYTPILFDIPIRDKSGNDLFLKTTVLMLL
jgi:hypothetical protein